MNHEEIMRFTENNHFIKMCGIQLAQDDDGMYISTVSINQCHYNPYGVVHGGLLYTIADATGGINARKYGEHPVTLNSDFRYFANVTSGILTGSAEVVRVGRTIIVMRVKITLNSGIVLAEGTFSYFYKKAKQKMRMVNA